MRIETHGELDSESQLEIAKARRIIYGLQDDNDKADDDIKETTTAVTTIVDQLADEILQVYPLKGKPVETSRE